MGGRGQTLTFAGGRVLEIEEVGPWAGPTLEDASGVLAEFGNDESFCCHLQRSLHYSPMCSTAPASRPLPLASRPWKSLRNGPLNSQSYSSSIVVSASASVPRETRRKSS